jgi:hypothetical protein
LNAAASTPCATAANCGAFFTIYDFNGYVPGSLLAPSDWAGQVQLTGLTNSTQNPTDNTSIENLTFVYTGPPNLAPGPFKETGFSAISTYGMENPGGTYTYQAQLLDGRTDTGTGSVDVPMVPTSHARTQ